MRQVYFATGADWLANSLAHIMVDDKPVRYYLDFLYDQFTEPGTMGSLLLILAMSTADQDISVAAIDSFIMLIEQGRLDHDATAAAMRSLFQDGKFIKANRWKKNFRSVAKASTLHSRTVYNLLESIFTVSLICIPKDLHHILELLYELQAENSEHLTEESKQNLQRIKLGGKTERLIDQLANS
jgi:hypothetical protein